MGKNVLASMRGDFGVARKYPEVLQEKSRSGASGQVIRAADSGGGLPGLTST